MKDQEYDILTVHVEVSIPSAFRHRLPPPELTQETLKELLGPVGEAYLIGALAEVFEISDPTPPPAEGAPAWELLRYAARITGKEEAAELKP